MTKNRTRTPVYLDPGMHPGLEVKGLMRTPEVAPGHITGHSYAHAHIAHIKNAREHLRPCQ